jgi:hypothetical protein
MITIKDIILICASMIENTDIKYDAKFNIYNQYSEKIEVSYTPQEFKDIRLNSCIVIGEKALKLNFDPILAMSVGLHESKFHKDIVGDGSIGVMQVIPKYWCKLQTKVNWLSKSQYQWTPKQEKTCKKKLKPNQYYDDKCKPTICDSINCDMVKCDLEEAGIIALSLNKKKNLRDMLFRYNKGNRCDKLVDKAKCIESGYKYADSVLRIYKKYRIKPY